MILSGVFSHSAHSEHGAVPLVDISHLTGDTGGLQAHPVVHPRIPEATLRHIVDLAFNAVHPGAIPNLLNSLEQTLGTTQAGYYVGRIIGDGYSVGAKRLASELEAAGSELLTPEDVARSRLTLTATMDRLRELGLLTAAPPAQDSAQAPPASA